MGKLRERRRRDRKRRLMMQLGAGFGATVAALTVVLFLVNGISQALPEKESLEAGKEQSESFIESLIPQPTEEEPETMQIVMVGDMLMHDKIIKSGLQEDGTYNFDMLFEIPFLNTYLLILQFRFSYFFPLSTYNTIENYIFFQKY